MDIGRIVFAILLIILQITANIGYVLLCLDFLGIKELKN